MFGYTGYSQKTEHLEKPLHTNRSYINTLMFVTWLKPSRGKQSTTPAKYLLRKIYYSKEIKLHELLIIDQLAKDPLCSLNRDHRPIGVGLRVDLGSNAFIFAPTNWPTVLALLATTCEQVAVSPETAMGCRKIRFLQAKEGYYCTFSLNNKYLCNTELRHSLK